MERMRQQYAHVPEAVRAQMGAGIAGIGGDEGAGPSGASSGGAAGPSCGYVSRLP